MTEKDRISILDALVTIFQQYGGQPVPSATKPRFLRIAHGDTRIAVGYSLTRKPSVAMEMGDFLTRAVDMHYHHFVFVFNGFFTTDSINYARKFNIILLDRSDLERELGKAHLRDIEAFFSPAAGGIESIDVETMVRKNLVDVQNIRDRRPELLKMLDYYRNKHTPLHEFPDPGNAIPRIPTLSQTESSSLSSNQAAPNDLTLPGSPDNINPANVDLSMIEKINELVPKDNSVSGQTIKPEILITNLPDICRVVGKLVVSQMELIPYFLYEFSCTNLIEGEAGGRENRGLVAVNGVTCEVEEWEPGFTVTRELSMDYIRLVPRVDATIAGKMAYNGVIQINTSIKSVTTESNGVQRNGTVRSYPDPSTIKLESKGIYYFPHWHVKGEIGSMLVDAVNGIVISSQRD